MTNDIKKQILTLEDKIYSTKNELNLIKKIKEKTILIEENFASLIALEEKEKEISILLQFLNFELNKNKKIYSLISFT